MCCKEYFKKFSERDYTGVKHYLHSLRVVEHLEKKGRGLNLTWEVRNGIACHSKGRDDILPRSGQGLADTLEGQVVRLADIVAYVNHDLDDAMRAGLLEDSDVPASIVKVVGSGHSQRIGSMVRDIIVETLTENDGNLHISAPMLAAIAEGKRIRHLGCFDCQGRLAPAIQPMVQKSQGLSDEEWAERMAKTDQHPDAEDEKKAREFARAVTAEV